MKSTLFIVAALIIGGLMPVQGSINAQMGQILGHPLRGTLMNFATGGVFLLVLLAIAVGFPVRENMMNAPWYLYTGGLMGVLFVTTVLVLIPEIGTFRVLAAAMVGQLLISALIDHYGWLLVPITPFSTSRIIGLGCLLAGLYLVHR